MSIVLQGCDPRRDAHGLAEAMMRAMYEAKHWALIWSIPLDDIIAGCASRVPHNLVTARDKRRHQKAVDAATGEVVGYARWVVPDGYEGSMWLDAQVPAPTEQEASEYRALRDTSMVDGALRGSNPALLAAMGNPLDVVFQRLARDDVFLELEYLTVHPTHQRRGIGATLVRSGLAQADSWGMKTIVMAKPPGLKLYKDNDFVLVETATLDMTKYGGWDDHVNHFLIREPRKGAESQH